MTDLVIFGAGDLARETALLLRQIDPSGERYRLRGFVVEDESLFGGSCAGAPIIAGMATLQRDSFTGAAAIAIGNPALRAKVMAEIDASCLAIDLPPLVHPHTVYDPDGVHFGRGCLVAAGCLMTTGIEVGDGAVVNLGCTVAHDSVIEAHCVLHPRVVVSGGVRIGAGSLIGTGAILRDHIAIAAGSQIAMGAVVAATVPTPAVVAGNPGRIVQKLEG